MPLNRKRLLLVAGAAALLLLGARVLAALYTDLGWYAALGARDVWQARLANTLMLRGGAWLLGSAFVFVNLLAVRTSVLKLVVPRRVANLDIDAEVPSRLLLGGAAVVALAVGALLAVAHDDWTTLAVARYTTPFGETDNYFIRDYAFWAAGLPLERAWYGWAQITLVVVSCLVGALYALTSGLRWERGTLRVAGYVRRHFAVLGALLLLLLAWSYRLERYLLVVDGGAGGLFAGAEHQSLSLLLALSLITVASAVMLCWSGLVGQTRLAFGALTLALVSALVLQQLAPALARWRTRDAGGGVAAAGYRGTQAAFSQRAYGIRDQVAPDDPSMRFTAPAELDGRVSLWTTPMLRTVAERVGRGRTLVGDVGWGRSPEGRLVATLVTRTAPDSDEVESWTAVVVDASRADPVDDQPPIELRPLPPVLVSPLAEGYALVTDPMGAVAAPLLGSGWRRVAHALAIQNLRVLGEEAGGAQQRLVEHRRLSDRVARLAPPFYQAADPTPLVVGDSLLWVVQLYTSVRTFPLSRPLRVRTARASAPEVTKYFRHAGVALVNAHTGAVRILRVPEADHLAASWMARLSDRYEPWGAAPEELRRLLPPAREAALAHALILAEVGGKGLPPGELRLAGTGVADSVVSAYADQPFLLPDGRVALALPLVGRRDRAVHAFLVAAGGAAPRTSLVTLTDTTHGWDETVQALRRAGPWARAASVATTSAIPRVLPEDGGAAFVLPIVGDTDDERRMLLGIATFVGDRVRVGPDLASALGASAPRDDAPADDPATLWRRMREALQRADWSAFGEAFERLGRALGARGG